MNNDLLDHVNDPSSPEAQQAMDTLKGIVKQMYALDADPGGHEGIGLPGGPRDVVIVGAGPGGLTAAVMGGTDGLDTLFIDAQERPGGQAKFSSRVENYPGFPIGATGQRLSETMYEQALRVGAEGKLGVRVTGLSHDPETDIKTLTLSNGETVQARSVIIAGGVEFRKMDIEGDRKDDIIYGDGHKLAKLGAGKTVVVAGGSNGAAQAALGAAKKAEEVVVVSRSPIEKSMSDYQVSALRNNPKIRVVEGDEIAGWSGDRVQMKSGASVKANALGCFFGGAPDTRWLPKEIRTTKGRIDVDDDLETSIPGVFAVGDNRSGNIGRIGAAVGDGQMAVKNVFGYFERTKKARKES